MNTFDTIVVGAGAAGLSAALVLGRARRRTLVVDAGEQSNRPAHGIGGLLGHDGRAPGDFYQLGRAEVLTYPTVTIRDGEVTDVRGHLDAWTVEIASTDGAIEVVEARTLVIAAGMSYRYPPLDGIEALWGGDVFHCPFCHGWEVRDRRLAVWDPTPLGPLRARMLLGWSDDVTLLTNGAPAPAADEVAALAALGITVQEGALASLQAVDSRLVSVTFDDGDSLPLGGLMVAAPLRPRNTLLARLGLAVTPSSPMSEGSVQIDPMGQTSVPGVWAAGDVVSTMPSVAGAIASGHTAAAGVVHHLLMGAPQPTRQK